MKKRIKIVQIIEIIFVASGIALLALSHYIHAQVLEGRGEIADAQGKVDTGKKLFSLSPATKNVGDHATSFIQKKINEGKEEADYYEALASKLQMGGILLILGGAGLAAATILRRKMR